MTYIYHTPENITNLPYCHPHLLSTGNVAPKHPAQHRVGVSRQCGGGSRVADATHVQSDRSAHDEMMTQRSQRSPVDNFEILDAVTAVIIRLLPQLRDKV